MTKYDVIILGVGGMGSAALFHLARRGKKVLGIERFGIPHDMGSSHGITRIIRLAYYEDPAYVPLLRRAFELWRELEHDAHERLLLVTGSIDASPEENAIFEGSRASCELHDLPHEILSAHELSHRFPGYQLPPFFRAVYQQDGGFLLAERCIVAHVNASLAMGAQVHGQEQVISWQPRGEGVEVCTDRDVYHAEKLIITAGAWSGSLIPHLNRVAVPERQVLGWFQPRRPNLFAPHRFPVFNLAVEEGRFYGFPVYGIPGFKIGRYHHLEQVVDPDRMDRMPNREDEAVLRQCIERYFPDANGPVLSMKSCMFTNSPDEHFIIDVLSKSPQVSVAAGFSGHGFKFCSIVGEILADLATEGDTRHDISLFRLNRFGGHI
ncbi:MAG TPA: N-methyl-L-tryptophan oxidase [Tepidisphaeraceae bacterium]|nr:N-methyl-L-tryptophan oxidase [Tepidisphaeraceae bacterium]